MGTMLRTYCGPKYAYSRVSMPPMEPPITAAICFTPRSSRTILCMLQSVNVFSRTSVGYSALHIIPDGSQWEFRPISFSARVPINARNRARTSIWAPQAVETDYKESSGIECFARATHQWAPPIRNISAAGQSMTDDYGIVSFW